MIKFSLGTVVCICVGIALTLEGAMLAAESTAAFSGNPATLRAAISDLVATFGNRYPGAEDYLASLEDVERRLSGAKGLAKTRALADFTKLQRDALIANPLVSGRPILFVVRNQYKEDHHNTATLFQTGEINTQSFQGYGALKLIDFARPGGAGRVETLLETPAGVIRDPDVSFDGSRILFSMRVDIEDDYHLYELNADGSGLTQLTHGTGISDIDPLYLADGDIAFASTREPKYCMCNRHIMANLFRMEPDGANIHQIGKSTLFEGHGSLTPDGRILYDRWEYVDRNFGDAQGLWTVSPDGTNHAVYWGNNTNSPGGVIDARIIPGTQQVLCIFGSCHDLPWGALTIVDRRLGLDGRDPVVRTWPADAIERAGKGDWDAFKGVLPKYEDPYPLSDKYFLVSRSTGSGSLEMGTYLVDVFGNEVLLHAEKPGCYDPMPLGARTIPPVIPSRRDFENDVGYFYVADVYVGTHMQGVKRGSVKYLRVVESPEKRNWTHPNWQGQGTIAPAMNWHDFLNKRILGTVPVEKDGSAYFAVPTDRFVYFQLLDEDGMMIQSMRSGTVVQPGETTGCVGCHEDRRSAPPPARAETLTALRRSPSSLAGWYGKPRLLSYMEEVQPVFDRSCVECHDYGKDAGAVLNLAADRTNTFNTSYNELWRKKLINCIGAGPAQIQQPYSWGSHASRLVEVIRSQHHAVELDAESLDRIVTWIDINGPYYPSYDTAYPDNLAGRSPLDNAQLERLSKLTRTPFAKLATGNDNRGPQISFDRPELSPCLARFKNTTGSGYREALSIIRAGRKMLAERPRADMPGFQPCSLDQNRQERYAVRQQEELRNRRAIRAGEKAYDIPSKRTGDLSRIGSVVSMSSQE